jgi:hypothetical protein
LYQYGSIAMTSAFASAMDVRWADSNIDRDAVCIANGCAARKTVGRGCGPSRASPIAGRMAGANCARSGAAMRP